MNQEWIATLGRLPLGVDPLGFGSDPQDVLEQLITVEPGFGLAEPRDPRPHLLGRCLHLDPIKLFMTAAPDLTWKITGEPIESANGIAYEFTFAGTNTGAWGPDTPATGKPFSFNGVTFMRVENGKIVYQGDYYHGLDFQKQLGWI